MNVGLPRSYGFLQGGEDHWTHWCGASAADCGIAGGASWSKNGAWDMWLQTRANFPGEPVLGVNGTVGDEATPPPGLRTPRRGSAAAAPHPCAGPLCAACVAPPRPQRPVVIVCARRYIHAAHTKMDSVHTLESRPKTKKHTHASCTRSLQWALRRASARPRQRACLPTPGPTPNVVVTQPTVARVVGQCGRTRVQSRAQGERHCTPRYSGTLFTHRVVNIVHAAADAGANAPPLATRGTAWHTGGEVEWGDTQDALPPCPERLRCCCYSLPHFTHTRARTRVRPHERA